MADTTSKSIHSEVVKAISEENLCYDEDNRFKANINNRIMIENEVALGRERVNACNLSLYTSPPTGEFPLEDIYACTNQRYRLLQILSDIGDCEFASRDIWIPKFMEKLTLANIEEFRQIVLNEVKTESFEYLARWDEVSHFTLRSACSRLFESLKWFVKQEIKLFHIRWHSLNVAQRRSFMENNGISIIKVEEEERQELCTKFQDDHLSHYLFKTRFMRVSQLLKMRRVYINRGWVYYTEEQAVYPIANLYEEYLNKSVRLAKAKYDRYNFDPKYSFFFRRISEEIKQSLFKFNPSDRGKVEIKDLDRLSLESFPLCMSNLHYYLRRHWHLRNGGRFQYNLFLKGIGVTLYDAIKFWRDIFTKKMTLESFIQHYMYSIRHNYGKLGKQADYPPLNCAKILDFSPGPLDHHGCPFQKAEKEELFKHMQRYGLDVDGMNDVWELVKNNVPQQACARVFELKHNVTSQQATAHPNIYYEKSRNILLKKVRETEIQELNSTENYPTDLKVHQTDKESSKNSTSNKDQQTITQCTSCKENHMNKSIHIHKNEESQLNYSQKHMDKKILTVNDQEEQLKTSVNFGKTTLNAKIMNCLSCCSNQHFSMACNKQPKKLDW